MAQFGSPLYVYDAALIEEAYRRFRSAFRYEPLECHYAIVCNKNHYIVRLLSHAGSRHPRQHAGRCVRGAAGRRTR